MKAAHLILLTEQKLYTGKLWKECTFPKQISTKTGVNLLKKFYMQNVRVAFSQKPRPMATSLHTHAVKHGDNNWCKSITYKKERKRKLLCFPFLSNKINDHIAVFHGSSDGIFVPTVPLLQAEHQMVKR